MGALFALWRFAIWLFKASIAILGFVVLLGEANQVIPDLMRRGDEFGLSPVANGTISALDKALAIVRYLVTEHFVLLAILVVSFGVCHHIVVGKPLDRSRVEFQRRRNSPRTAKKGRRK